jgi:hypothetical protein
MEEGGWDWFLRFTPLSRLVFDPPLPVAQKAAVEETKWPSKERGETLEVDRHLACFDQMYFAVGAGAEDGERDEWRNSWSPAWRFVGKEMHFREEIVKLTQGYLRRALGWSDKLELPPVGAVLPRFSRSKSNYLVTRQFIAIHVRRGDFIEGPFCSQADGAEPCFATLDTYGQRVEEVKEELRQKRGIVIPDSHVVLTSGRSSLPFFVIRSPTVSFIDEKSNVFWQSVRERGWTTIDHAKERTLENHGEWYLTIIDVVAQSLANGFVGTEQSTVSLVSARRVEDWNHGPTRLVKFGSMA